MSAGRSSDHGLAVEPRGSSARHRALGIGLAVVLASLALVGCAVRTRGYTPEVKGPGLRLEPASIDFGRIRQTDKVQGGLAIKNVGDALLVIKEITTH
jgi:hypothetical protein